MRIKIRLRGTNVQRVNGSPLNPDLHMHIGLWFTTLHVVP